MARYMSRLFAIAVAAFLMLSANPAEAAKGKTFLESDDAKEKDEPQKYLADYDKLVKGKDADWVYFPGETLKKGATVLVKDFDCNGRSRECKDASRDGKDYAEQWLEKQGFKIAKAGAGSDYVVEGNIFNAWEPHGAARYWGGWAANPGVGMELMVKDAKGATVAEVRHKSKGTTVRDAVENGLEDVAKSLSAGK